MTTSAVVTGGVGGIGGRKTDEENLHWSDLKYVQRESTSFLRDDLRTYMCV